MNDGETPRRHPVFDVNSILLIAGLGNSGPEYADNRHNAGFWFLDALAEECGAQFRNQPKLYGATTAVEIAGRSVRLFKPGGYMNESGRALQACALFHKVAPERVLVAHDEIDFPAAKVRLKCGGGHGGHNGLRDVAAHLGSDFWRLRIGVGHPGSRERVTPHVLGDATAEEQAAIRESLGCALAVVAQLVRGEFDAAVNALHAG